MKVIARISMMVLAFVLMLYGLICLIGMRSEYEIGLVLQFVASFGLAILFVCGAMKKS